jgi:hypothetical protein
MAHTPGPWYTGIDEDCHMVYSGDADVVADTLRDDGDAETESANATLISAAPELLAALEILLLEFETSQPSRKSWIAARKAISKAKGE